MRTLLLVLAVLALAPAWGAETVLGAPAQSASVAEPQTPDEQVDRGLAALVALQAADGSIGDGAGVTALAGMALLAGGHTPMRGQYAAAQARALGYILAESKRSSGYLGSGFGNMYAHGFATLYLAEVYGMAPEPRIKVALEDALDVVYHSQNAQGGWRYAPVPLSADISITVCQAMALRAAVNAGVGGDLAIHALERAVSYVRSCYNGDGTFNYQPDSPGGPGNSPVPRCAAGIMTLISSGLTNPSDPVLGPALALLRTQLPQHLRNGDYFSYGQYYAAQAMYHSPDPRDWPRYWALAQAELLRRQQPDGLWSDSDGAAATAYGSAMALIILQIPNNYLPIFQW